jgi:hypothetical protein
MTLNTMARRMSLEVPGLSDLYATTLLNEALHHAEDEQMWSFQLAEAGWITPGLLFPGGSGLSAGTVTVTIGSNIVQADTTAAAAWAAYTGPPLLTACQFRSPFYSLYNIIGYGTGTSGGYGVGGYGAGGYGQGSVGFSYFVLDRPWMEPAGTGQKYMVYQAYFPVPVTTPPNPDFRRFFTIRDTTNNAFLDYWSLTQKDLAVTDPERTDFDDPSYVIPYQVDNRPGTSTPGSMLFELWPHPLSVLPYTFAYLRRGPSIVNPGDILPYPLTEEMILHRARADAYLWKEAQKGENIERGAGADYKFLAQAEEAKYKMKKKDISQIDRGLVELFFTRWNPTGWNYSAEGFATINGGLNVGRF